MDYGELLRQASARIQSLPVGTVFTAKSLFDAQLWKSMAVPQRQQFGRCLKNEVCDEKISDVQCLTLSKKGTTKYKKIR